MPGGWEWLIIIGVLVLLFGAKRLPEMARSVGQSARVFKGEMKGLKDDDGRTAAQAAPQSDTRPAAPAEPTALPPVTHSANGTTPDVAGTAPQPAEPVRRDAARPHMTAEPAHGEVPGTGPGPAASGPPPSGEPRRHDDADRAPVRAAEPARHLAGRDRGHHDLRLHLVRRRPVRHTEPRRDPQGALLLHPGRLAGHVHRGRLVHPAGHRPVRPVQPPAQGRDHRRGGAGLPGVALPAVAVHHPRALREGTPLRAELRLGRVRAVRHRRRAGLLRHHPGPGLPAHHRRRDPDHGADRPRLLRLPHRPADHLRGQLRDPVAGGGAQPRRGAQLRQAAGVAPRADLRPVRLRRDRHPRPGPVLDAGAGARAGAAVRTGDPDRPGERQAPLPPPRRAGLGQLGPRLPVADRHLAQRHRHHPVADPAAPRSLCGSPRPPRTTRPTRRTTPTRPRSGRPGTPTAPSRRPTHRPASTT